MEYPFKVGEELTSDGLPMTIFEPDPLVREAAELLLSRSLVADMGVGRSENSLFMAEQGHVVHGIEKNVGYASDALRLRRYLGGAALNYHLEVGDVTELPLNSEAYDAVIATRILHEVTPTAQHDILKTMRRITKLGGLNIIRAYVGTESEQTVLPHLSLYDPGELEQLYLDEGWMIEKTESNPQPLTYVKGGPRCTSTDQLVARKTFRREQDQ